MLISKIDLLPYVDFDPMRALEFAHRINPELVALRLSPRTGDGMNAWLEWIVSHA